MKELSQPIATTFMLPAVWAELYVAEMVAVEVGTAELTWTNFICAAACCDAHKSNDQLMTTRRKDWTKSTFNIRRKDKCDIENSRYPTHLSSTYGGKTNATSKTPATRLIWRAGGATFRG